MITSQITQTALQLLGQLIKVARKQRHLSQLELAQRLDVSRQTVVNIEKGLESVAIGSVFEAARIVGVPVLAENDKQLNQWQQILNGFDALLPAKPSHKKIELDDEF